MSYSDVVLETAFSVHVHLYAVTRRLVIPHIYGVFTALVGIDDFMSTTL